MPAPPALCEDEHRRLLANAIGERALERVLAAEDERVELDPVTQRLACPRAGDEHARGCPRPAQRVEIAGGEVHPVAARERRPADLLRGAVRLQPRPEGRDRPLAGSVEQRQRVTGGGLGTLAVHVHGELAEARDRAIAELVPAQRGEQRGTTRQAGQLDGRNRPSAGGLHERFLSVHHLARSRDRDHTSELDPLDVSDDPHLDPGGTHRRSLTHRARALRSQHVGLRRCQNPCSSRNHPHRSAA